MNQTSIYKVKNNELIYKHINCLLQLILIGWDKNGNH